MIAPVVIHGNGYLLVTLIRSMTKPSGCTEKMCQTNKDEELQLVVAVWVYYWSQVTFWLNYSEVRGLVDSATERAVDSLTGW